MIGMTILLMLLINGYYSEFRPLNKNMVLKVTYENPELVNPFVKQFEKEFNTKVNTIIRIGLLEPHYNGICLNNQNIIILNSLYINEFSVVELEQLIYHELMHCHYKMPEHDNREDKRMVPKSLMNAVMFDSHLYIKYRDMYIQDLKQKIKEKQ